MYTNSCSLVTPNKGILSMPYLTLDGMPYYKNRALFVFFSENFWVALFVTTVYIFVKSEIGIRSS